MAKRRMLPTQRTLQALRKEGHMAGVVERFIHQAGPFGKTIDLFGFIDVIALNPGYRILGIQCCAQSGFAAHLKK